MMHFFLFYCVVPYCTAMMILQCIYTHCNSNSYRHSFDLKGSKLFIIINGNWNIIFIKPTKAFNSICTFSACFKCDSNDNQFLFESHHEKTCLGVYDQV